MTSPLYVSNPGPIEYESVSLNPTGKDGITGVPIAEDVFDERIIFLSIYILQDIRLCV